MVRLKEIFDFKVHIHNKQDKVVHFIEKFMILVEHTSCIISDTLHYILMLRNMTKPVSSHHVRHVHRNMKEFTTAYYKKVKKVILVSGN